MNLGRRGVIGLVAIVNVISFLTAVNVMADDVEQKKNYGQLKLGIMQPTGDLDDANFDTGGDVSVAYGRYLTRNLILEAAFGAFASENDQRGSNTSAGSYKQENTLVASSLLVTLKGVYPLGPVDLFGGFGAGVYEVTLDSEIDSSRLGDFNKDDTDTVFGVHLVAGLNYNITERFFLGMEAMYRWTGDVKIDEVVATIPVQYDGDLNGYTVTFNAGFRF